MCGIMNVSAPAVIIEVGISIASDDSDNKLLPLMIVTAVIAGYNAGVAAIMAPKANVPTNFAMNFMFLS